MEAIVAFVVSLLCVFVVVIISLVILYQNSKLKEQVSHNIQDLVDQVNNSASYAYKFDISQDENIKTMEQNISMVNENLNDVIKNVKVIEDTMQAYPRRYTQNVRTGILTLGDRFTLTGMPVNDSSTEDDTWVRLLDKDGANMYGGLAVDKMFVKNNASVNTLAVEQSLRVPGGKSIHNGGDKHTMLPGDDGVNYIRGNTEVHGNLYSVGNMQSERQLCIKNTCINENELMAIKKSNESLIEFPPLLTGERTIYNNLEYTVTASSHRTIDTLPHLVFNRGTWQSAIRKYDDRGIALHSSPLPSNFVDSYSGEWLALTMPYPLYLYKYVVAGDLLSFRIYGFINQTWRVLDERIISRAPVNEPQLFSLLPPSTEPISRYLIKISRISSNTGFCTLSRLSFHGLV